MNLFAYTQARDLGAAVAAVSADPGARYLAGGTNILDLMKETAEQPALLVDITRLPLTGINVGETSVTIGALARMSDVADAEPIRTEFPLVAQSLLLAASPQLRNMATIGGNLLQRTRCPYFRDVATACNKRVPGSGCSALEGINRLHAILGTSEHCINVHPSDLAVALVTVGARVHTTGPSGGRVIPLESFYVLPGDHPEIENVLAHGEMITAVELPRAGFWRRSQYAKLRTRSSYEFALVSVAAALDVDRGTIRTARLGLGGVAPVPWRASSAETALTGARANDETYRAAAEAALAGARSYGQNGYKIDLAKRAIVRTLRTVGAMA